MELRTLFLLFIIYSFIGWIMETIMCSYKEHHLINRGFLIGPYLPIFGVGALLITLLLNSYQKDIFVLFIMSSFLGAILEYITSYILEKIFKTRWWNYEKSKFNLNGRICLEGTLGFGLLGVLLIKILNPFFIHILNTKEPLILSIIASILALIFIVDLIISFKTISKIKIISAGKAKDTTEEISKTVRETLKNHSILSRRLVNAFPNLKVKIK